ncbi:unnamed protein product [Phytomonas sp. Hart1]|nr:unnamed protein product [Phytomonas sp. Hart1]|eukprot:CCW71505.1 unnamed protein product [Phytomonas sp. isolate Hart1]
MLGGIGMSNMYGGGLGMSNMYGGGLGMNNMYGSGLGMNNMYGNGLGMGNMYGGGIGFSGGVGSGMIGNTLTSNINGHTGGTNDFNSNTNGNLLSGNYPQQQQQGLLPSSSQDLRVGSPITLGELPPPLSETPEERAQRIRTERHRERQLIQKQRQERKQLRLQAKMEIAGHLTNVLVQTLRSAMELFAVCFGTYYSMKAVRAFANSQETISSVQMRRGPMGELIPVPGSATNAAVSVTNKGTNASVSVLGGRWKWIMFGVLFLLGEIITALISRARNATYLSLTRRLDDGVMESEYDDDVHLKKWELPSSETDDCESVESLQIAEAEGQVMPQGVAPGEGPLDLFPLSRNRRVYVAVYDYEAQRDLKGYLSFKAGDEFVIQDYAEGTWCKATACSTHGTALGPSGLVPSNFLRLLEAVTKL